jgi:hypothetical protein
MHENNPTRVTAQVPNDGDFIANRRLRFNSPSRDRGCAGRVTRVRSMPYPPNGRAWHVPRAHE